MQMSSFSLILLCMWNCTGGWPRKLSNTFLYFILIEQARWLYCSPKMRVTVGKCFKNCAYTDVSTSVAVILGPEHSKSPFLMMNLTCKQCKSFLGPQIKWERYWKRRHLPFTFLCLSQKHQQVVALPHWPCRNATNCSVPSSVVKYSERQMRESAGVKAPQHYTCILQYT